MSLFDEKPEAAPTVVDRDPRSAPDTRMSRGERLGCATTLVVLTLVCLALFKACDGDRKPEAKRHLTAPPRTATPTTEVSTGPAQAEAKALGPSMSTDPEFFVGSTAVVTNGEDWDGKLVGAVTIRLKDRRTAHERTWGDDNKAWPSATVRFTDGRKPVACDLPRAQMWWGEGQYEAFDLQCDATVDLSKIKVVRVS